MRSARRAATGPVRTTTTTPRHAVRTSGTPRSTPYLRQLAAGVVAIAALSAGISAVASPRPADSATAAPAVSQVAAPALVGREDAIDTLSRSTTREPLADVPSSEAIPTEEPPAAAPAPVTAVPAPAPAPATRTLYATVTVNVRADATSAAALVKQLAVGTAVTAVGDPAGDWQQIDLNGTTAYVSAQYLAATAPKPAPATTAPKAPSTSAPAAAAAPAQAASGGYPACSDGSGIESGLTSRADNVYRAVCAAFPSITSYGGRRGDGEHADGRAIDIMVSGATGRAVAEWARANAGALGIQTVIFEQKIWTTQRASEGWRSMSDRGSATANHYDHVHVQVL